MDHPTDRPSKEEIEGYFGYKLNSGSSDPAVFRIVQALRKNSEDFFLKQSLFQFLEKENSINDDGDPMLKYKVIQRKLALLLHSFLCDNDLCSVNHCISRKSIWSHLVSCRDSKCSVSWCKSSKQILVHWIECNVSSCVACCLFKKAYNLSSKECFDEMLKKPLISPKKINDGHNINTWKPKNEKEWSGDELRESFIPILNRMFMHDKECAPFMRPVDPVLDQCPDYFDIIKKPMDFGTVADKLEQDVYKDPWEVVIDIYLVFGNAWLYNKKCSIYHKYSCKLADVYEAYIDKTMRSLGFCCGQRYEFTPLPKYCDSRLWCNIPVLADYYSYNDQYSFCERCFTECPSSPNVSICKDPTSEPLNVEKQSFVKKRNLERKLERFIKCSNCGRLNHVICVMYLENVTPSPFVCKLCRSTITIYKPIIYRAKDIPSNTLSEFIETRVRNFFLRKKLDSGEVTIRVVASSKETTYAKPRFKKYFPQMADEYPYIAKAIFAFQDVGERDVCFFGMHVQEYGSEVPAPNTRRVYLAYLDSVLYFEPPGYRTSLYHEILLAYTQYIKNLGFVSLHIWSCPPCEGDDYIFNCHPTKQKIPKAKRLQEWYRKLLEKATNENTVANFTDILSYAVSNDLKNAADMPYFDGDFWPTSLEENIKEIEKSESASERNSTGKPPKSAKDKNNQKQQNRGKKVVPSTHGDVLVDKIYSTLGKYREMFFVVEFLSDGAGDLPPVVDPDPIMPNDLMHERSSFLIMSREKQAEFSSLRRAKHSTLVMLHEILTNSSNSASSSTSPGSYNSTVANVLCSICNLTEDQTFYTCRICESWKCCSRCFESNIHPHPTEIMSTKVGKSGVDALEHASHCQEIRCKESRCDKFKAAINHTAVCDNKPDCNCCRILVRLALLHARRCLVNPLSETDTNFQSEENNCIHCEVQECPVVFCREAKEKLNQMILKQRKIEERMLKRRTAAMMVSDESDSDASSDKGKQETNDFQRMGSM